MQGGKGFDKPDSIGGKIGGDISNGSHEGKLSEKRGVRRRKSEN
jgi:hypothetical protein